MATYGLLRGSNLHLRRQGKSIRGWLRSPGRTLLLALAQKPTLAKVPPCLSSRLIMMNKMILLFLLLNDDIRVY